MNRGLRDTESTRGDCGLWNFHNIMRLRRDIGIPTFGDPVPSSSVGFTVRVVAEAALVFVPRYRERRASAYTVTTSVNERQFKKI